MNRVVTISVSKAAICVMLLLFVSITVNAQVSQRVYDEDANPNDQIDAALVRATQEGKNVVCQVGGNWCPWCLRFAAFITNDEDISSLVSDNYVYIHVNYNPSVPAQSETTLRMLKRLGNPVRFGFPVLVVLDKTGRVRHIQDSSYLEEGKGYDKEKVMRFFYNWKPEFTQEFEP